jgi:YD repeat-containing protein
MASSSRMWWLRPSAIMLAILGLGALAPHALFAANGSVIYTYDSLGRLITASYDTGVCISYSYDANGNRTSEKILVTSSSSIGVWGCFNWNNAKWGS